MKKYLAELLGTFALTLAVSLSLGGNFPIPTPVIAALTLGLFVYSIGHISGAHINPAVTLGALSVKKIGAKDAISYIVAQFIGAGLALLVSQNIAQPANLIVNNNLPVFFGELLGMFFFSFGIAAAVNGKVSPVMNGMVIGGSLLLGIFFAAPLSNGILNPAVATGIGSFSLAYLLGPIVGSVLGMRTFAFLSE